MGPLVGQGEVYQAFQLQGQTVTRNAQVNTFFTIYEEGVNAENLNKISAARNSMLISQQRFGSVSSSTNPEGSGQFPGADRNVMAFNAA